MRHTPPKDRLNPAPITQENIEESLLAPQNSSRFAILLLIWSLTPLLVVISVQELPALWAFAIRFLLAAPLAHLILKLRGQQLPLHNAALKSYVAGALGIYVAMILCYLSAVYLPSGIISMVFGLSPLISGIIGLIFLGKQLSGAQWLGICIGLVGLVTALGLFTGQLHVSALGLALVIAAMLISVISLYLVNAAKANIKPMAQTVGSLWVSFLGSAVMLPFILPSMPTALPSFKALFAIGFLLFFASILAFICLYDLNKRVSPTAVSLVTIVTPILATLWGNLFNAEVIHTATLLGLAMIVSGLSLFVWGQGRVIQRHPRALS